jgi:asparagine synthase (glutamine-hydrolysing)
MQQIEKSFLNICNMMTLRYDPSQQIEKPVKDLSYESMKNRTVDCPSFKDVERELRRRIRKHISKSNSSKISIALSSGVDSNLILLLLRDEFPSIDINCITVSFDEFTEAKASKKIAENKSASFHEVVVDDPLRDLPALINIVKEPRWNIYNYYFLKKAKDLSNIIFTGDGGDELFGGYSFRYKKYLDNYDYKSDWKYKVRLYLECHDRDWVPDQNDMFDTTLQFDWDKIYLLFKRYFDNDLAPLDQVFMADYYGKLMYDFVPAQNKFLEHFKLIGFAPLLESSIIDMAFKMSPSLKYNYAKNIGKIPLRKIISLHGDDCISQTKLGFSLDLKNLWTRSAKEIVISNLDKGRIFEDRIIQKEFYQRALKRIEETCDIRYISKLLHLLSLEVWYKMFITSEIRSKESI